MVRKHSRSCTVEVQKYICIVDFASGLSQILSKLRVSKLSCFDKKVFVLCFRVRECVTRFPVVLLIVLSETEVVVYLGHSSLNPELSQFIVPKLT